MVGRIASSHWFRPWFSQARNYRTGRRLESKSPRNLGSETLGRATWWIELAVTGMNIQFKTRAFKEGRNVGVTPRRARTVHRVRLGKHLSLLLVR